MNEWMNQLMNEKMNEWMNVWMCEWMNEWMNNTQPLTTTYLNGIIVIIILYHQIADEKTIAYRHQRSNGRVWTHV